MMGRVSNNSELKKKLLSSYETLERKYTPSGVEVGTYNTPVNFKESMTIPVHRWYGYKEGFSPSFVNEFIKTYARDKNSLIFDPFGGVGTTGLEAIKMGYDAALMDVNPLGLFVSKAKTKHYSTTEIDNAKDEISCFSRIDNYEKKVSVEYETVTRYFDPITWDSLLRVKSYISDIKEGTTRDLFSLALLSLIEDISTHHKNGNGVKKKIKQPETNRFTILRDKVVEKLQMFICDIETTERMGVCSIFGQSNLEKYKLPIKADVVLTSPPYANCFDYSKVYLTELWVGGFFTQKKDQKDFREKSIISHVHYTWKPRHENYGSYLVNELVAPILSEEKLWSKNIIPMLKGYFADMGKFLYNLSENLNTGATVGIVVGNSVYGGIPIATDIILAKQAEEIGFECLQIKVYRKVIASSQQMVILSDYEKHFVRESLIVLKWQGKKK